MTVQTGGILMLSRSLTLYNLATEGLGFTNTTSVPLVRSSYHADQQTHGAGVA